MSNKTAVLLMAYGSPSRMEDVMDYLSDIYEGKPVPEYAVEENQRKYRMVNGVSPSNAIIDELRKRLEMKLSDANVGVYLGNKHWHPKLEATLGKMMDADVDHIIAIPLFPFASSNVRQSYLQPMKNSMSEMDYHADIDFINGFSRREEFSEIWSKIIKSSLQGKGARTGVFFSAHSLPLFRNSEGEYSSAFVSSVKSISGISGLRNFSFGYQSRGKYGNSWLEPSLSEVFDRTDRNEIEEVLAVPLGFCYEHLEILYDLDIEFGDYVKERGLKYRRTGLPDARDEWVDMFRNIAMERTGAT